MGNFQDYILKFGTAKVPNKYIASVTETPSQRTELKAERDDYTQELIRVTSPYFKSKISFNFIDGLSGTEFAEIKSIMANGLLNATQRKYSATYWNSESQSYVSGTFYVPDVDYEYSQIDPVKNEIYYKSFRMALIEY